MTFLLPSFIPTQGILEEEEPEEEETLVRKASKVSYGRGAEGKVRRKGTITHIRDSIKSNKSAVEGGRSDIVPRRKSTASGIFNPTPTLPLVEESPEAEVQLEMGTVHGSKTGEA